MKINVTNGIVTARAETEEDVRTLLSMGGGTEEKPKSHRNTPAHYRTKGQCPQCEKKFYKRGLHVHILRAHSGIPWKTRGKAETKT